MQTTLDADRLARFRIPLVQVNTDPGFGGECHLDANMVRSGLGELPLDDIDILIIENVGNLVCPAEFRVGEDVRVMVYSVTEGEEKPLKYPLMFRSADLVLVNKVDLLEHLDFDLEQFLGNLDAVNPGVRHGPHQRADRARVSMSGATGSDSASKMAEMCVVSMFTTDRGTVILPPLPGSRWQIGESGAFRIREASSGLDQWPFLKG